MSTEILFDWQRNLVAANDAVRHVRRKMDIGTSNKMLPNFWGLPARVLCVAESRKQIVDDLKGQAKTVGPDGTDQARRAMVDTWAAWANHYGCGNCGENSAMAFVHLRDTIRIFPLDWMQIGDFRHAFVVIGRAGVTNPSNASTWNAEAVVCDPYKNDAMPAVSCSWIKGEQIRLLYRQALA